jgi:transcriptional regulator with XRE-family HTH domain
VQIVALREQAGLTQVELAERTGISQADISRIERGATSPTAKTLQRIAEALNADVRLVAKTA